ncbi:MULTISPECIES: hypothetical protein [Streptomyces]|uniref:Uncharacterized protein n=2 Tax=Streptomyces TaxID=1883 RepID=A0A420VAV1_9ACTN|nr:MULTISPECIES: hypothetical protein [Streptomyces]KNE80895.1 hypothetical protein ADZ36_19590 [Streptomyces fradiae]OFA56008.1 hypothetical protein BEN35_06355 [Streptomyces fradiae]PQM25433.1 hypothetical protein Sfr7A_01965 [Streptomyces xinghaiensis]RKM99489.1 hypothetical protein SFRA_001965 [Streptomyces xinghaiensis]RNC76448.1 hypothetical protein DC095_002410 [Streptomyces xinghaiensis]
MTDEDVERTDERVHPVEPWWAGTGTWGAVALIVVGGVAAAWFFLGLPGTSDEAAAQGYHQAARVIAVGSVIAGCALLGRRRARAGAEEANERESL